MKTGETKFVLVDELQDFLIQQRYKPTGEMDPLSKTGKKGEIKECGQKKVRVKSVVERDPSESIVRTEGTG